MPSAFSAGNHAAILRRHAQGIFAIAGLAALVAALTFSGCRVTGSSSDDDGGGKKRPGDGAEKVITTFDPAGGIWQSGEKSGTSEIIEIEQIKGQPLVLPESPLPERVWSGEARNGTEYTFLAWGSPEGAEYNTIDIVGEETPTAFSALWQEPPEWGSRSVLFYRFNEASNVLAATEHAATFPQGLIDGAATLASEATGYILESSQIYDSSSVTLPYHTVVKTGGVAKWFKFDDGGIEANPFDFSLPIEGETKLVLKWTRNVYTLTFNTAGDSTDPASPSANFTRDYTYPATVVTAPSISRGNYDFGGWKSGGTTLNTSATVIANATYTAQWTGKTYTITLHANGGAFSSESNDQIWERSGVYPNFKPNVAAAQNDAFNLAYYTKNIDGTGAQLNSGLMSSPVTSTSNGEYYAIWTLKSGMIWTAPSATPWLGATATIKILTEGDYKIELWGAQGGPAGSGNPNNYSWSQYQLADGVVVNGAGEPLNASGKPSATAGGNPSGYMSGGRGAYVRGDVHLKVNDTIMLRIGGARVERTDASSGGGFNGGGSGYGTGAGAGDGAGGGASDLRVNGGALKDRIMVAAGGGGSSDGRLGGSGSVSTLWKGGYAGIFGASSPSNYDDWEWFNSSNFSSGLATYMGWESGVGNDPGRGALRDKGGRRPYNNGQAGIFAWGGNASGLAESYGAGGGGWFGGSSGGQQSSNGSGGGGSSYVSGVAGFIACTQDSAGNLDRYSSPDSQYNNRTALFTPRYAPTDTVTDLERATSWNGYTFTNVLMIDGGGKACTWNGSAVVKTQQQMPMPTGGSYPAGFGNEGPGSAKISFVQ